MKIKQISPACAAQNSCCQVCKGEDFIWIEGGSEKLPASSCQSCQGKGYILDDKTDMKVCAQCQGSGKRGLA